MVKAPREAFLEPPQGERPGINHVTRRNVVQVEQLKGQFALATGNIQHSIGRKVRDPVSFQFPRQKAPQNGDSCVVAGLEAASRRSVAMRQICLAGFPFGLDNRRNLIIIGMVEFAFSLGMIQTYFGPCPVLAEGWPNCFALCYWCRSRSNHTRSIERCFGHRLRRRYHFSSISIMGFRSHSVRSVCAIFRGDLSLTINKSIGNFCEVNASSSEAKLGGNFTQF